MIRHVRNAVVVGVFVSVFAVAATASAAFEFKGSFSGPGAGPGQLAGPGRADVDQETGNLFVADRDNDRVEVFAPSGATATYLASITNAALDAPLGVAIDQADGSIYVSDVDGVLKFHSSFALDLTFSSPAVSGPLAVDPSSGDLLVADTAADVVRRYDSDGTVDGAAFDGSSSPAGAFEGLLDIAANSTGDIYVVDTDGPIETGPSGTPNLESEGGTSRVLRFGPTGDYEAALTPFGANERAGRVAVNLDDDSVAVSGAQDAIYWDATPEIFLFGEDNLPGESFTLSGTGSALSKVAGLAFHGESARFYVAYDYSYWNDGGSYGSEPGISVYIDPTPPTLVADPATEIPGGVRLTGTVNPNGFETEYRFRYRELGTATWTEGQTGNAGDGTEAVDVELELTGLEPVTEYEFQLLAESPRGQASTPIQNFESEAEAPTATTLAAAPVGETSARLNGLVDPRGSATTYYYELGTSTAYGTVVPAAGSASAGKAIALIPRPRMVTGLQPGTNYHYRIVAVNSSGTTQGADRTFTTLTPGQIEQRAIEMVSPPDKNGQDITNVGGFHGNQPGSGFAIDFGALSSADGDSVAYTSLGSLPGAGSSPAVNAQVATRTASGWRTQLISPTQEPSAAFPIESGFMDFSEDLTVSSFYSAPNPPLTPEAAPNSTNVYRRNADGSYQLVTIGQEPNKEMDAAFADNNVGSTRDLSKIYIVTTTKLMPEHEGVLNALYQWDGDTDTLSYVGLEPGTNEPFPAQIFLAGPESGNSRAMGDLNAISDDGESVFFVAQPMPGRREIYVRLGSTTTVPVSASVAGSPDPNGHRPAEFWHASSDGSLAYFTSGEKLTDDATTGPNSEGSDLYRWEEDGTLTDLTVFGGAPAGARVQGVLGGADDGSSLFFVARGALAGDAVEGELNLYRWEDDGSAKGAIEYVTTDVSTLNYTLPFFGAKESRVSLDGEHLVFASDADLAGYRAGGVNQLYVYDAEADTLECASCIPTGAAPSGPAELSGVQLAGKLAQNLTEDGSRLFFVTPDPLVPEDSNGKTDPYVYEHDQAFLLSSGTSSTYSNFHDATADGDTVFITTRSRLVGWDVDDKVDLYALRVGGGLPEPPPTAEPCQGEGCAPPVSAPPVDPSAATINQTGPGSPSQRGGKKPNCTKQRRSLKQVNRQIRNAKGKRKQNLKAQKKRLNKQIAKCNQGGAR